jgi:hypothetical protein
MGGWKVNDWFAMSGKIDSTDLITQIMPEWEQQPTGNGDDPNSLGIQGLKSPCENSKSARFCSARLQASTFESSRCPPEGGGYTNQNRVLTRTLKPMILRALNVAAEAAIHKD